MSLNWDISKCADIDLIKSDEEWQLTQSLIFSTVTIGIGDWTPELEEEIYFRLKLDEKIAFGNIKWDKEGNPLPLTREDVNRRIGLKTNVWPMKSREEFTPVMIKLFEDSLKKEV